MRPFDPAPRRDASAGAGRCARLMLIEYGIARRKPAMPSPARLVRPTLLAAALCAANLAVAELPASAPFTPAQQQAIRQISASEAQAQVPLVASAAAASVAKTIEGEKQAIGVAKDALEVGRKSVDWWLSNISVWLGGLGLLIGAASIGIPLWMGRKQRAEWNEKLDELIKKLNEAESVQRQAQENADEIAALLHESRHKASLIPNSEVLKGELSDELLAKLKAEKPPQVVKLIKQAWDAQHREDWQAALPLWSLLSLIESQDSNVWFNLGVVHSEGHQNWIAAAECFQRSNLLDPHPSTLFNWASCIYEQGVISKQDEKLREAIDKYREAYGLDENFSIAYFQRAATLVELATWVSGSQKHLYFAEAQADYENAIKHGFQVKRKVYEELTKLMTLWAASLAEPERQEKLEAAANYKKQAG